jgi:hypothetical protein
MLLTYRLGTDLANASTMDLLTDSPIHPGAGIRSEPHARVADLHVHVLARLVARRDPHLAARPSISRVASMALRIRFSTTCCS